MVTRSGSNKFHGSGYDFLRDSSMDANEWFAIRDGLLSDAHQPAPIPQSRRNNYGFTIGGPIIKNKTFFFVDYDGLRSSRARTRSAAVPTDLMVYAVRLQARSGIRGLVPSTPVQEASCAARLFLATISQLTSARATAA
jgi:hypothetical protein